MKTNFNRSTATEAIPLHRASPPRAIRWQRRATHQRVALPTQGALLASRLIDITASALLVCVFALPMLLIALAIKLTSRGPVIYRQQRMGLGGQLFVMYKFRTMCVDAETDTGPVWSKPGDMRCTRLGAILRRYSVDELPQLFNVLQGDMSLVGPRPERPYFVERFSREHVHYGDRLAVLPGITGWAQVNGWRGNTSLEKRLEFDLFYIKHWSLLLNIRIMLQTPLRVFIDDHGC